MDELRAYTPADIARKVTALGIIINPTIAWSFLCARYAEHHPGATTATLTSLPIADLDLEVWLDEFLDHVEAERNRLSRNMQPS